MKKGKHVLGMPKGKHIFGTARVGEKGQIVIPKEARELFNIESGDTLLILGDDETGIIISKPEVITGAAKNVFDLIDDGKQTEK